MWDFLSEIEGPLGALLIIGTAIFLVIRTLKRYILVRDHFKLDVPNCCVMINKERIFFEEIDFVTVEELEQPNVLERSVMYRAGSHGRDDLYMTQIIFHLKSDCEMACTFNRRTSLYKALKQLKPYVTVRAYIEDFKPTDYWLNWLRYIFVVMLLGGLLLIILFHN